uniref:Uncharacterized protein n=1 Tax=Romanomermis culicivorax TaxID=13658 RepID=A0A915KY43_ROMCU
MDGFRWITSRYGGAFRKHAKIRTTKHGLTFVIEREIMPRPSASYIGSEPETLCQIKRTTRNIRAGKNVQGVTATPKSINLLMGITDDNYWVIFLIFNDCYRCWIHILGFVDHNDVDVGEFFARNKGIKSTTNPCQ